MKWAIESLGSSCTILDNKRKPITKSKRMSGIYPYYGATGIVDYVDDFIFNDRLVLVGEDGAKWKSGDNTAFIVDGKIWVNNHAHVLKTNQNLIDSFLIYYLNHQDLTDYITGLTVPKLNQEKLRSIPIPIPPLPEQQKIVEKLDTAFALIETAKTNIEKNIQNAKELFQSKLNEVFSKGAFNYKKLRDIFDVRDGTHDSPKYFETGFPLITSKNLKNGVLTDDKIKFIQEDDYNNINKRSKVDIGDILFAMIGTIGNPVVIVEEPNFAIKNVALIKSNTQNNSYFYQYYLDSKIVLTKMQNESKGATQKFVSLGYMRDFMVPNPDLETQQKIVAQLNQLSAQTELLQEKYNQKLANLEELKKSILEKAFKGELV